MSRLSRIMDFECRTACKVEDLRFVRQVGQSVGEQVNALPHRPGRGQVEIETIEKSGKKVLTDVAPLAYHQHEFHVSGVATGFLQRTSDKSRLQQNSSLQIG